MLLRIEDVAPLTTTSPMVLSIYIEDVWAQAVVEAPCLASPTLPDHLKDAAKAILRQAVLRWARAGDGGVTTEQKTAGPFSQTTTFAARGEGRLFPQEVTRLQKLCLTHSAAGSSRKAFTVRPRLS